MWTKSCANAAWKSRNPAAVCLRPQPKERQFWRGKACDSSRRSRSGQCSLLVPPRALAFATVRAATPASTQIQSLALTWTRAGFASATRAAAVDPATPWEPPPHKQRVNLKDFPPELIRNFSIIAHIDHGKSTLADRLLELSGTITKTSDNKQVLDKLKVERERGITVKAQTATMFHVSPADGREYMLNLIDTPGHVDFSYEVSRSLSACQGTLLVVDAAQGIQAQTVANFYLAYAEGLHVIPVLNKIDLPGSDPAKVKLQIENAFEIDTENVLQISAKTGLNCLSTLSAVIEQIPSPKCSLSDPFKGLLFDTWYDNYVGVVCMVAVKGGSVCKGDVLLSMHSKTKYTVTDVGIMYPEQVSTGNLQAGQVGYVQLGMKTVSEAHIGDTFHHLNKPVEALPGFQPAKSMVFAGLYPMDSADFPRLNDSLERLLLTDSSVTLTKETSLALGQGFRLGFLGLLHMDVFRERLEEEYAMPVLLTAPTVPYEILYDNGTRKLIRNPADFPESSDMFHVKQLLEPMVLATLVFPSEYTGGIVELCGNHRGTQVEYVYIDDSRVLMKWKLPLGEILAHFYDSLKSRTSGYASFDYEEIGYTPADITKVSLLVNGSPIDALSQVVHGSAAERVAKAAAAKLKSVIEKELFEIVIQGKAGAKIVARETIKALRKNVTAKCYGGDITRRMKLLKNQQEGKKKLKRLGVVNLSQEAFLSLMKKDD